MDYESKSKIVDFDKWCPKCRYYAISESEKPCDICLTNSVNQDSHKPTEFAKK